MIRSDFHMHTRFCDGKNTAEEMILSAIDKGLTIVGLSGHGYTAFDGHYCMTQENTMKYRDEVNALKEKYRGKIRGRDCISYLDIKTADILRQNRKRIAWLPRLRLP